ncbi:MAG: DUF2007 domain-containing protein [Deltaproteobacteria bacterium]|nr:DUF2007 domain-containing protein [Deltaproteobacteria bacterium]
MEDETWEVVCSASGMINANILVGKLETEGIPTKLKYEAVGTIYAITVDGLGEVKIMVPTENLEKARTILSQTYNEEDLEWEGTED